MNTVKDAEVNTGHKGSILTFFHDMDLQLPIIPLWKVLSVVPAATFFPPQRRAGDQSSDGQKIAIAPRVRGRGKRRRHGAAERGDGVAKAFARTEQSDRSPHQVTDRFAVEG